MKFVSVLVSTVFLSNAAMGASAPRSYWFLLNDNRQWCGYSNEQRFQAQAGKMKPLESARITLASGVPQEITYQVQPESGDWVVADKYNFISDSIKLRRATIFVQNGIQIFQDSDIIKGRASPLKTVSVKNVNGSSASDSGIDYPDLPIKTRASDFPFLAVAQAMSKKSISMLCGSSLSR